MKISSVSKFVGAGVIAASLAVVPLTLPAQAQNTAPNTTTQPNSNVDATGPIRDNTERDNNDWGWLGLLGLIGLAGLARKDRKESVHHVNTDPHAGVR
jgi:hypothetical protein